MTDTQLNIDFFKQFIANNPGVLEKVGFKKGGRPPGAKNMKNRKPKDEIEVPNGLIRDENGEVVKNLELSKKATKELVEQIMPKKKREYKNPETKEKMRLLLIENRKKAQENKQKAIQEKIALEEANTTTIKIKPPKRGKRSIQRPDEEEKKVVIKQEEEEVSDSESEEEIIKAKKKVDKKKAILDEIDNELKKLPPPSQGGKYSRYLGGW
jgi:hypothetical protein